jgi:hypothetical protein
MNLNHTSLKDASVYMIVEPVLLLAIVKRSSDHGLIQLLHEDSMASVENISNMRIATHAVVSQP